MDDHSALDRLEARLERQAARIDALYRALEARGILPPESEEAGEAVEVEDFPLARAR
jgi:hypothetical protein